MPRGTSANGTRCYNERIGCAIREAFLRLGLSLKPLGERWAGGFGLAGAMLLDLMLHKTECTVEAGVA
jgi:hypothetical protein